ncbi:response regulator [Paraburkholderia sp. BR13439]|uniref:Response regulator n=1 Tax=Paraburkholderia youngii TaxID=2782701 RepID=A0A7Y6N3J4_9BURK|nr:response regulator [Paraburkholderia youngii]NUY04534.1 response regulator [Paraburkholderia youngii]
MANVLLVDDDPENLWSLQIALESHGHRVSVADNAQRAMDILRRHTIEILITDYEMPDIDGAQLSCWVRAHPARNEMPVLMLSAAPEPLRGAQCWNRFLRKPVSLGDLIEAIDAHVAIRLTAARAHYSSGASVSSALRYLCPAASRLPAVHSGCWP